MTVSSLRPPDKLNGSNSGASTSEPTKPNANDETGSGAGANLPLAGAAFLPLPLAGGAASSTTGFLPKLNKFN